MPIHGDTQMTKKKYKDPDLEYVRSFKMGTALLKKYPRGTPERTQILLQSRQGCGMIDQKFMEGIPTPWFGPAMKRGKKQEEHNLAMGFYG